MVLSIPVCWNFIVRLSNNESVLTCIMNYELKWDYMDIWGYSTIRRWPSPFSGQWLVAGPLSGHISVYIHWRYGFGIELLPILLFTASQMLAGAAESVSCLFYMLELWLLQRRLFAVYISSWVGSIFWNANDSLNLDNLHISERWSSSESVCCNPQKLLPEFWKTFFTKQAWESLKVCASWFEKKKNDEALCWYKICAALDKEKLNRVTVSKLNALLFGFGLCGYFFVFFPKLKSTITNYQFLIIEETENALYTRL